MEPSKPSFTARLTGFLMNFSMLIGMVVLASLLGVAGASVFIYHHMGNPRDVVLARPKLSPNTAGKADHGDADRPQTAAVAAEAAAVPAANDATEWHFAEFSDQPRYIDVTYDEGRKHARLKVNTVLSTRPDVASVPAESAPVFSDDPAAYGGEPATPVLNDPGSRFITDPRTGRVIGVDGTAGAAAEAQRVESLPPAPATPVIRHPKPEIRVAAPVIELGRPVFGGEFRPAQVTTSVSTYLPIRKALPVDPEPEDGTTDFDARSEIRGTGRLPVRAALPVFDPSRANRDNRLPYTSDSFLRRD